MYIVPFERLKTVSELNSLNQPNPIASPNGKDPTEVPFKEIFQTAIENIKETDAIKNQDTLNLAMGNTDDLHNIIINMDKAMMAVEFATEVRNKALDAYNEIMRMNV